MTTIYSDDSEQGNEMNVGDRVQVTLDVEVIQVNDERVRLQFKTDSGTIVRFWCGVDRCQAWTRFGSVIHAD
jgi:hypothetical protein